MTDLQRLAEKIHMLCHTEHDCRKREIELESLLSEAMEEQKKCVRCPEKYETVFNYCASCFDKESAKLMRIAYIHAAEVIKNTGPTPNPLDLIAAIEKLKESK